jgi:hypothetical protein
MSAIVKALDKLSKNVPKKLLGLGNMNAILHNRTFLYIVFAFSLLNLYVFTVNREFVFITFFILFGFLTSFFSKNMVVILLLSAVLTNTIKYGSNLYEGMENEEDDQEEKEENMENQDDDAVAENMENNEEDKETSKDSKDSKDSNIQSQILSNIKKMNEYLQKLTLSPKVDETKVDEPKK